MNSNAIRALRFETFESRRLLAAELTDFGQIGLPRDVEEGWAAFVMPEIVGRSDLNGDGDTSDLVLHLHNAERQMTTNVGVAAQGVELEGGRAVILVSEPSQGSTDLNGDGDASDHVLHVYDTGTAQLRNLGFALPILSGSTAIAGDLLIFTVQESANGGIDLNGDGDTNDSVLHVYDMAAGTTKNVGIVASGLDLDGSRLAFTVHEANQGNADLNHDGDSLDNVLHVYDTTDSMVTNLEITTLGHSLSGDHLAVRVSESMQGEGTDLNGDGDTSDAVLHLVDLATKTTTNLQVVAHAFSINDKLLAFDVIESEQGGIDLNSDGDAIDTVMHAYDLITGVTHNSGLATNPNLERNFALVGGQVRFEVSEYRQGETDLNGDGYKNGQILYTFEAATGVINHRIAFYDRRVLSERLVVFRFYEEGNDLNGDGDVQDKVLRLYDPATATLSHLPYAVHFSSEDYRLDGNHLSFPVIEADQGRDLNGDGDMSDQVLHVHDLVLGTTSNLGIHATNLMLGDDLLLFVTSEHFQGQTDLNGDGDAVDPILYLANLSPAPPTPAELVEQIAADIVSLDLQSGVSNSLATKIDGAFKLLGADVGNEVSIVGKLNALIHELEAQRDKHISAEDADALIADVEELLSLLEPL